MEVPDKVTMEPDIDVDGSPAICSNGRPIGCIEVIIDFILAAWDQFAQEHTDLWPSIDQVSVLCCFVGYVKAGRIDGAAIFCH